MGDYYGINHSASTSGLTSFFTKVDNSFEDQISQQPDDIIVWILSRLPIKDAGRTSVLSSRWRNLWKLTTSLNLVVSEGLDELSSLGRSNYVKLVNEVLRLHERPHLDEIRIQFVLNASESSHIDEWMKFMILKRTKRIEIHLNGTFYPSTGQYSPSSVCYQHIKSPSNLSNVMCLGSLTLMSVDVDGEFVEYLLSKCPHLEMLSISCSRTLSSLRVAGPSLPLKYLKIYRCISLQTIELSAPKLATFVYSEMSVKFVFGNNPLLSMLYLGEVSMLPGGLWAVTDGLRLFSSYFSQLETLSLTMGLKSRQEIPEAGGLLRNLKHLILAIDLRYDVCLFPFTRFLQAAPLLEKIKLKLNVFSPSAHYYDDYHFNLLNKSLKCLKEVEIRWYYGGWCDFELAKYLAINAINLEKMVLDTRWNPGLREMDDFDRIVQPIRLRDQVEELEEILQPQAKLIVLA